MSATACEVEEDVLEEEVLEEAGFELPAFLDRPLLRLLVQWDSQGFLEVILTASAAGLFQGFLIAVVNSAAGVVEQQGLQGKALAMFLVLLVGYVTSRAHALDKGATLVEELVRDVRERANDQIRTASYEHVRAIDRSEILGVLSRDAETMAVQTPLVLSGFSALVTLVFACFYIGYMSMIALAVTVVMVLIAAKHALGSISNVMESMERANATQATYLGHVDQLLAGFDAVKHHEALGEDLAENYVAAAAAELEADSLGARLALNSHFIFVQSFFFVLLAGVVFLLPTLAGFDSSRITHLVAMVLFLLGPITEAVGAFPALAQADVASATLNEILERLHRPEADDPDCFEAQRLAAQTELGSLTARGLGYDYTDAKGQVAFSLGPVDFDLKSGEIVFLVGGNGSGKSTFLRALTGLLRSDVGEILLNDVPISDDNRLAYREWFSPIYAEFHLFDRLYGLRDIDPSRVRELLDLVGLTGKTDFEDGRFTRLDLSTGQRKRLALVVALLDDRPIFIFDEVAADQDPEFRQYFYESLLPDLKAQGKTGIVVTHDDRYFRLADRVVKMKDGQLQEAPHDPAR